MFERLKMFTRVASLYVNRQKGWALLKQIRASDLSGEDQDRILDIMRRMRIIRASDVQASESSESSSRPHPPSVSKARRQGQD